MNALFAPFTPDASGSPLADVVVRPGTTDDLPAIADRVTNICERTIFIATGELLEIDATDDEWDDEDES